MMLVTVRQGDFIKMYDNETGLWVFASGPDFPTINRDFPAPHDGATFWHSGLDRYYFWSGEHREWHHLLDHPTGAISYFSTTGHNVSVSTTTDGLSNMTVVDPATTLNESSLDLDSPSNGRLRYTGSRSGHAIVQCTFSLSTSGNHDLVLALVKTGTIIETSRIMNTVQGGDMQGNSVRCLTPVDPGDYFELHVGEIGSTSTVSVRSLNLFAQVRFHL